MKGLNKTFQTTFEGSDEEIYEVIVTGVYCPGHTGTRIGFERFAEPDEPANFEIESVVEVGTGREFSEDENPIGWERLIEEGIEQVEEDRYEEEY